MCNGMNESQNNDAKVTKARPKKKNVYPTQLHLYETRKCKLISSNKKQTGGCLRMGVWREGRVPKGIRKLLGDGNVPYLD